MLASIQHNGDVSLEKKEKTSALCISLNTVIKPLCLCNFCVTLLLTVFTAGT